MRQIHRFIAAPGPLINAICQPFYNHAETVPVVVDAFDAVTLVSAEKKQRSFFQWIQPILEADDRNKAGYSPAQIGTTAPDNNPFAPAGIPKHYGSPS